MNFDDSWTLKIMLMLIAQFKKDKEFFLEKLNRDNFRQATLETLEIDDKKGKNLYSVVYRKFLKKMKLDKYKYSNARFRPNIPSSEFNVKTKVQLSGITEPSKTQVEEIKEDILHEHPLLETQQVQELDEELENFKQASYQIPLESVAGFWDGVIQVLKWKWSMIEGLKPEERQCLGLMWQPFFQKYTSEKFVYFVIPILRTIGMIFPKIREGRRLSKEKQKQEEKQKDKPKPESKKENKKPTSKSGLVYNEEKRIWEKKEGSE